MNVIIKNNYDCPVDLKVNGNKLTLDYNEEKSIDVTEEITLEVKDHTEKVSLFSRIIGVIVTGIFVIIAAFMEMFSNDDLSYSIKLPVKSKIRVNDNDVITITHDNSKYNNNKYLLYKNDVKTSCEAIYTKENVDKEVEENSKLNLTMFSVPFVLLLVLAVLMLVGKHYVIGAVFAVILIIVLITWVLQDKKARKEYENFYSKCKLLFDGIPIKQP